MNALNSSYPWTHKARVLREVADGSYSGLQNPAKASARARSEVLGIRDCTVSVVSARTMQEVYSANLATNFTHEVRINMLSQEERGQVQRGDIIELVYRRDPQSGNPRGEQIKPRWMEVLHIKEDSKSVAPMLLLCLERQVA